MPILQKHGPVEAFIIDDTGFPKKGKHSVAWPGDIAANSASRTISTLRFAVGREPSCEPSIAYRLYLPQEWANDRTRRAKAGVPEDVPFRPSRDRAGADGSSPRGRRPARYGPDRSATASTPLCAMVGRRWGSAMSRASCRNIGLVAGRGSTPAKAMEGQGRPPKLMRRDGEHQPVSVKDSP